MAIKISKKIVKKSFGVKFEVKGAGVGKKKAKLMAWAYLYLIFADRHKEPFGFVENVYVQPEFRSQGLGSKLMQLVIKEAKKRRCYKLIFTSRFENSRAHKFYEKFGFKKWGHEFRMDLIKSKPKQRD